MYKLEAINLKAYMLRVKIHNHYKRSRHE